MKSEALTTEKTEKTEKKEKEKKNFATEKTEKIEEIEEKRRKSISGKIIFKILIMQWLLFSLFRLFSG